MTRKRATTTVRVSTAVLEEVKTIAAELGVDILKVVDVCLEDCIAAYKSGKPVDPRVIQLREILKTR